MRTLIFDSVAATFFKGGVLMNKKRRCLMYFTFVVLGWASSIFATCGLEFCSSSEGGQSIFAIGTKIRNVQFTKSASNGSYDQFLASFEYFGWHNWVLGGIASYVSMKESGSQPVSGSGNPVIFFQNNFKESFLGDGVMGVQFELPLNGPKKLVSAYLEVLPYLQFRQKAGHFFFNETVGYRHSFEPQDTAKESSHISQSTLLKTFHLGNIHTYGDEHSVQEGLFRIEGGYFFEGLRLSGFVNGVATFPRRVLDKLLITAGIQGDFLIGSQWKVTPIIEVPITSDKRNDVKVEIGARLTF